MTLIKMSNKWTPTTQQGHEILKSRRPNDLSLIGACSKKIICFACKGGGGGCCPSELRESNAKKKTAAMQFDWWHFSILIQPNNNNMIELYSSLDLIIRHHCFLLWEITPS